MKSWIVRETPRSFIWGPKSYFAWCNDCAERKKPCLADWYQVKNAVWEQAWPGTSSRSAADVPDGALSLHLMSREEARAAPLTTGFRYAPRRQ
jgi:hypothetical protein